MRFSRTAIALLLCAVTASAQSGAVLTGTGRVLINDLEVRSVALVAGDVMETGDDTIASITQPGANVILGSRTRLTFSGQKLQLIQGHASISTSMAYSVEAGPLVISPQAQRAHYDVARLACRVTVIAHDSALKLSDGSLIPAGQTATRTETNCNVPSKPDTKSVKRSVIPDGQSALSGAALSSSAIAIYLSSREPQASPSSPR